MGRGRQARKTCPTVLESVPVDGPSDQQDSKRGTSRFVGKGAGCEVVQSVSYPLCFALQKKVTSNHYLNENVSHYDTGGIVLLVLTMVVTTRQLIVFFFIKILLLY